MLQIIKSYLKFLWKSSNQHGVHSPFVFSLVTKCFYDKSHYPEYSILKEYRKSLLQNHEIIEVTNFSADLRIFKRDKRQIAAIAKNAGISPKRVELLFRVVRYFQPETILEIGTSLGLATSALSLGNPKAKITTLEGCTNTIAIAKLQCQLQNFNNIDFVNTEFLSYLNQIPFFGARGIELVYFDGNHSKQATLEYFNILLPTITNDSVWIFDDIHWSAEMEEAWEEIKNHSKVTVTIDTYVWGFVFFRREQEKEHFTIRI